MAANDWQQLADTAELATLNANVRSVTLSAKDKASLAVELGIGVRTVQRWFAGSSTSEQRNIVPARLADADPATLGRTDLYRLTLARLLTREVETTWANDLSGPPAQRSDVGPYFNIAGALNAAVNMLLGTHGNFWASTLYDVKITGDLTEWDLTATYVIDSDRIKTLNATGALPSGEVPGEEVPDWFDDEVD